MRLIQVLIVALALILAGCQTMKEGDPGKETQKPEKKTAKQDEAKPNMPHGDSDEAAERGEGEGEGEGEDTGEKLGFKHVPMDVLKKKASRYAEVVIEWDETMLNEKEIEMVKKLVEAAKIMDELFWMQTAPTSITWREGLKDLAADKPMARALLDYVMINYGPYDRLDGMEPFLGDKQKPKGANYYPVDLTKEEFDAWLKAHPEDESTFKSNFTVIRRDGDKLVAIPYSKAYEAQLKKAHDLLKEAAALSDNESLKTYLTSRAEAFLSDDYFQSDMDWMDLDSKIEVTIGPYEVYEDHLFGYKAAFEAFVTLKDPVESKKLDTFKSWLVKLEKHLPIPDEHKNFNRGQSSPMFIVDEIFTGGDTRAGVQTIAFNLPNDERVREQKGSKKVMLRNVGDAKFHKILTPIAAEVLAAQLQGMLHPRAYSNHTLLHEISHGLGPGTITVDGKKTTVNLALKNLYPHLEEAKADTLGLYNALFFIDQGVITLETLQDGKPVAGTAMEKEQAKRAVFATFLAGIFRSTRFGVEEAHGKANLIIFNYLREHGAFIYTDAGQVTYDYEKAVPAVEKLAHEILMIQALGDFDGCKAFIEKYEKVSPEMQNSFDSLVDVPVDIKPVYNTP